LDLSTNGKIRWKTQNEKGDKRNMKASVETLKQFIKKEYIDNEEMSSPDMNTGVRDILTDIIYIAKEEGFEIGQRVQDALDVYYEEMGAMKSDGIHSKLVALINDKDEIIFENGVAIEGFGIFKTSDNSEYAGGFDKDGMAFGSMADEKGYIQIGTSRSQFKIGLTYSKHLEKIQSIFKKNPLTIH